MLTVERKGAAVNLKLTVAVPFAGSWDFAFTHTRANEVDAGFLAGAADRQLRDFMSGERQRWYEKGYKDGRGKKAKRGWFPSVFNGTAD